MGLSSRQFIMGYFLSTAQKEIGKNLSIVGQGLIIATYYQRGIDKFLCIQNSDVNYDKKRVSDKQ